MLCLKCLWNRRQKFSWCCYAYTGVCNGHIYLLVLLLWLAMLLLLLWPTTLWIPTTTRIWQRLSGLHLLLYIHLLLLLLNMLL